MRRLLVYCFITMVCVFAEAKTTYIPTYYTNIQINGMQKLQCDSSQLRECSLLAEDERYAIIVMHDSVTKERVKAIKRWKMTEGWATAAAVLSGVSATLQPLHTGADAVKFMTELNLMHTSAALSSVASTTAHFLQRLLVTIRIENYSSRELVINDLQRGLTWFVEPESYIDLTVGNPEINKFRIAYAETEGQKKDFVSIIAGNTLNKETIAYEDDKYFYYDNTEFVEIEDEFGNTATEGHLENYERFDKKTCEHTILSIEEFNNFLKQHKK